MAAVVAKADDDKNSRREIVSGFKGPSPEETMSRFCDGPLTQMMASIAAARTRPHLFPVPLRRTKSRDVVGCRTVAYRFWTAARPRNGRLTEIPARSRFGAFINLMFGYDDRIGRVAYWLGLAAAWAITGFFFAIVEDVTAGTGDIGRYVAVTFIVGTFFWMHSAITVKRLHDRDRSAFWYLIYGIAPFGLFIAAIYFYIARLPVPAWTLFVLSFVGLFWVIIELGFMRGTPGPNRFGPVP
jgi:uncharacterized membrane protein YhaH (DUF805 family)